ncbi:MAG: hypothetical protein KGI02_03340 [Thaumarchaeota archaeon]|nr:hypothetical protein [Nitrososphaerota archaeon]MDE1831387.1 hypothetical protein [Nitrososphaerota archaeon]MDE1840308.1 hypothetical protein [Nitrososphaerota archaeon]
MMSCGTGKMSKKKIAIFSAAGIGTATIFYFAFATHNPTLAAMAPTFLTLGLCPAMCAAMGGAMWFGNKFAKKKKN